MSEVSDFLKDLEGNPTESILEQPIVEGDEPDKVDAPEGDEFKAKNRREKRLLEKNQQLREEAIAATARLQGIEESKKIREESEPAEYLKRVEKIYGSATPEAIEATNLLKEALQGLEESATKKAFEKLDSERSNEAKAVQEEEKNLDNILDNVEDNHGIDMSSETERKGFLTLLEKLSPKDQEGNIIEYADADATAELYLSRKEKTVSRAKELASRSLVRSGSSQPSKLEDDAATRFLKENGII